ncbi:FAD-binding oxidoreductase [Kaistia geumhonensis]|uniref:FAD/FMN-containing dehydrogenase n=1 Tax=Kaistia geumhonensis TaxID=410839 RepID=A0ABU0MBF4_9HYPH|nr:FAD-binding oxidoreductase [Kaistia geumhonensis]MCX5481225.1 FAD-binding oxidoreductase [Kaistia geumhonensis]MDQ0518286.1 FAD/FMN-containing dehydrogenase [Kaistia geumhonensis]
MKIDVLKAACKGTVVAAGDADFLDAARGGLWNRLVPDRLPDIVVKVVDEDDIIAAVNFAREAGLKVAVRGGGHNWAQPTLRHGGMLIDLQKLTRVISIDVEARRAVIQPIISNRDIQKALNPLGLAFPTGHCPEVKASGYFLSGGMAWNPTVWGSRAESLEAIELVTAAGELIKASETENADYFWAARGAGPGFFGIVTKYYLKLYPLPKAIHGSVYFYRLEDAPAIGTWLGDAAPRIAPSVELSQFIVQAPAELKAAASADNGWLCMVTGSAFEDTPEAARAALRPLEDGPIAPIASTFATPMTFEQLFDASGALWPEGLRSRVEATFSDHSPGEMMKAVLPLVQKAPSPMSVFLFTIFCGPNVPAPQKNMALSMHSKVYGGPWTMWWDAKDDDANADWHRAMTAALRPFNLGYYVGEANTVERPATAVEAFSPEKWQRLCELRDKYDPDRLFFDYFDGFAARG